MFMELNLNCDLTSLRERVLCLSPMTMTLDPLPLLTTNIYLEWQQVKGGRRKATEQAPPDQAPHRPQHQHQQDQPRHAADQSEL